MGILIKDPSDTTRLLLKILLESFIGYICFLHFFIDGITSDVIHLLISFAFLFLERRIRLYKPDSLINLVCG